MYDQVIKIELIIKNLGFSFLRKRPNRFFNILTILNLIAYTMEKNKFPLILHISIALHIELKIVHPCITMHHLLILRNTKPPTPLIFHTHTYRNNNSFPCCSRALHDKNREFHKFLITRAPHRPVIDYPRANEPRRTRNAICTWQCSPAARDKALVTLLSATRAAPDNIDA